MKFKINETKNLFEDIDSMRKYFPKIADADFLKFIEADPTYTGGKVAGNYARWLLNLANGGRLSTDADDLRLAKDLLTKFDSAKNYLKNRDIMQFRYLADLAAYILDDDSYTDPTHRQEVRKRQKERRNADIENEADLVYEDSDWEVWVPKTFAASCKLGQGTRWCTASTESDNYFNQYTEKGPLYIILGKENDKEKYQFHFESDQFMDENDDEVDLALFLSENPGLEEFFHDKFSISAVNNAMASLTAWTSDHGEFDANKSFMADALNGSEFSPTESHLDIPNIIYYTLYNSASSLTNYLYRTLFYNSYSDKAFVVDAAKHIPEELARIIQGEFFKAYFVEHGEAPKSINMEDIVGFGLNRERPKSGSEILTVGIAATIRRSYVEALSDRYLDAMMRYLGETFYNHSPEFVDRAHISLFNGGGTFSLFPIKLDELKKYAENHVADFRERSLGRDDPLFRAIMKPIPKLYLEDIVEVGKKAIETMDKDDYNAYIEDVAQRFEGGDSFLKKYSEEQGKKQESEEGEQ